MSRRFDTWLLVCAAVTLAATASHAQAPEARLSLERTVAAICAKADFDRDSYRPFVCEPECRCGEGFTGNMDDCEESAPDTFEFRDEIFLPARDALCTGACLPISGAPCTHLGDCPVDNECFFLNVLVSPDPLVRCTDLALPCEVSADCAPGYSCSGGACVLATGVCPINEDPVGIAYAPAQPIVCDTVPATSFLETQITLSGVSPPDSPNAVTCSLVIEPFGSTTINSNDALACIAQVETAIGQACTPFSP